MKYPPPKMLLNLTNLARVNSGSIKNVAKVVTVYSKKQFSSEGGSGGQKLLNYPALPLDETISKFLISAKPLLTEAEFAETEGAANDFQNGVGKELQGLLEEVANKEKNWLAQRWLNTAYLQYRDPVTVYSSPGMSFPITSFGSADDWIKYAANVINGMAEFKLMVDAGKIPVQKMGKLELDNSQFGKIFGTNRRPARFKDELNLYPNSKHVVVLYKNHFFKLPIISENCKPISPKLLKEALASIVNCVYEKGAEIGVLTTDTRDNWAESYQVLKKQTGNDKILCEIETALFTVSLDDCGEYWSDRAFEEVSRQTIHGGGTDENSSNRWMDKTIQLIVNRNGLSGFTYEHSPAEGQGIAMIIDFVSEKLKLSHKIEGDEPSDFCVKQLKFADPNPCLEQWIEAARRKVNSLAKGLDIRILQFKDYGRHFIKENKFSPDSYIQMSFQLAFYRLHKIPGAQYETAHLRIFDGGRTETIRSCSNESVKFAQAMLSPDVPLNERCELMSKAINSHRNYTNMALHGKGVDRHLLGLKLMAIENKIPIPEFYSSPGFKKSAYFRISTSQVATKLPAFMSYGPLTPDGYACCYNPRDCDIILAVTCWKASGQTAEKFANAISASLKDMAQLCNDCCAEEAQKSDEKKPPKSKL